MSNYPYFDPTCEGYALQQRLVIPTSPNPLTFVLGPDDVVYETQDAGKTIIVKYKSFTREIKAVLHHFTVTLNNINILDYEKLRAFAENDFKSKVRTTGEGSISLYHKGTLLEKLYIGTPIEAPKGWIPTWVASPVEILESVTLKIYSTEARWF